MALTTATVPPGTSPADLRVLLAEPARALRAGGLVAFPTETVYGLGADALSADAVDRIFRAKGRPADNPLIVHVADASWLDRVVAEVTPLARKLAEAFWPGPLTLVLQASSAVPEVTRGGLDTVAVRVPANPLARELIALADVPVAAPSANASGRPSPTTAAHVAADLADKPDWLLDGGPCQVGIESTVVDARGELPVVLRDGAVTREQLGALDPAPPDAHRRSPGRQHPHYQPVARVVIAPPGTAVEAANGLVDRSAVGLVSADAVGLDPAVRVLARPLDAEALAAELYGALRAGDAAGVGVIVVEAVAADGIGRAVMDRLRRAAGQVG